MRAPTPLLDDISLDPPSHCTSKDPSIVGEEEELESWEPGSFFPSEGTLPRSTYCDPARDAQIEAAYLPNVLFGKAASLAQEWAAAIASAFELPTHSLSQETSAESPRKEGQEGGLGINSPVMDSPQVQEVSFRSKKKH